MHLAYWSIAQTKNRETEASGMGWELFRNYVIARDKFRPDYFLYENNKSMSRAIREQITAMLGVEPVLINSALVSAQNRQRLYWVGRRDPDGSYSKVEIEQPEDRGVLLRDILESGVCWREKGYTLRASEGGKIADSHAVRTIITGGKEACDGAAEPVSTTADGKAFCVTATEYKGSNAEQTLTKHRRTMVAEPACVASRGRNTPEDRGWVQQYEARDDGKTNALTTVRTDNMVAEPVRIGTVENGASNPSFDSKQYRVYSPDAKSVTLCGEGGGMGAKTGLYAAPAGMAWRGRDDSSCFEMRKDGKSNAVIVGHQSRLVVEGVPAMRVPEATVKGYTDIAPGECVDLAMEHSTTRRGRRMSEKSNCLTTSCAFYEYCGTLDRPVYRVEGGLITIKGRQYPIKLRDGCYIIRKLTVTECKRLQTVPEWYVFPVSDSQAYRMLGNGWTCAVIEHIMSCFDGITTEPLDVLSMYDGMACGHIALTELGATINSYYATEIDKYAVKTASHNFPDIIQLGDAFRVRDESWAAPCGEPLSA